MDAFSSPLQSGAATRVAGHYGHSPSKPLQGREEEAPKTPETIAQEHYIKLMETHVKMSALHEGRATSVNLGAIIAGLSSLANAEAKAYIFQNLSEDVMPFADRGPIALWLGMFTVEDENGNLQFGRGQEDKFFQAFKALDSKAQAYVLIFLSNQEDQFALEALQGNRSMTDTLLAATQTAAALSFHGDEATAFRAQLIERTQAHAARIADDKDLTRPEKESRVKSLEEAVTNAPRAVREGTTAATVSELQGAIARLTKGLAETKKAYSERLAAADKAHHTEISGMRKDSAPAEHLREVETAYKETRTTLVKEMSTETAKIEEELSNLTEELGFLTAAESKFASTIQTVLKEERSAELKAEAEARKGRVDEAVAKKIDAYEFALVEMERTAGSAIGAIPVVGTLLYTMVAVREIVNAVVFGILEQIRSWRASDAEQKEIHSGLSGRYFSHIKHGALNLLNAALDATIVLGILKRLFNTYFTAYRVPLQAELTAPAGYQRPMNEVLIGGGLPLGSQYEGLRNARLSERAALSPLNIRSLIDEAKGLLPQAGPLADQVTQAFAAGEAASKEERASGRASPAADMFKGLSSRRRAAEEGE